MMLKDPKVVGVNNFYLNTRALVVLLGQ